MATNGSRWWWVLVPALLSATAAEARVPLAITHALESGQYRVVADAAKEALRNHPGDPDLLAMAGIAASRLGSCTDALGFLEEAEGSAIYDRRGVLAHADALRDCGRGEEAASLRRQWLSTEPLADHQRLVVGLDLLDDLRHAGDAEGAREVAWELISLRPASPAVLAGLAEVELDAGNLDEAAWDLWLADREGTVARSRKAAARLCLADGDTLCATKLATLGASARLRTVEDQAYWGLVLLDAGEIDAAAEIADRWRLRDSPSPTAVALRERLDALPVPR